MATCKARLYGRLKENGYMMTSSIESIFRVTGPLCGEFTGDGDFPHKGQRRGALVFSLIYASTNGWVNNRDAGDLRRHYDVTVNENRFCNNWYMHQLQKENYPLASHQKHCNLSYTRISWGWFNIKMPSFQQMISHNTDSIAITSLQIGWEQN